MADFFKLNEVPRTQSELDSERAQLQAALAASIAQLRRVKTLTWVSGGLLFVCALLLDSYSSIGINSIVVAGIVGVGAAVIMGSAGLFAGVGVGAGIGAVTGVVFVSVVAGIVAVVTGIIAGILAEYKLTSLSDIILLHEQNLSLLGHILPEHCPDVVKWCREDEVLRAYQAAVANQGRVLTEREYVAIKEWVKCADQREKTRQREEEIQQACLELREPVR